MFGLTKREQRWKAEQHAAEVLATLAGTALKAAAQIRVAEAQTDAEELARLRAEAASFHMAYRMKCDEETKAQAMEIERLRDVLHRMLEAPTTQISVTWKGAVRQALALEPNVNSTNR